MKKFKQAELTGCGDTFRVSQVTNEIMTCGKTKLNGKSWFCNYCMMRHEEGL